MKSRNILQALFVLLITGLLVGCSAAASAPVVDEIIPDPNTTQIDTLKTVALRVNAQGTNLEFEWSADRGTLSNDSKAAVIYTAPDSPGLDLVTVKVKTLGGEVTKSISFNVVAPPGPTTTETPLPADTPTSTAAAEPTAAPEPIVCNLPPVTKNLFPQLADAPGQFPMYGPVGDDHLLCQAVYDTVRSPGKLAVHVKYDNVGKNFGWWGVAFNAPNSYDASQYNQFCFWVYAQTPNQSFRVKMRDTAKHEQGVVVTTSATNQWEQICTDISAFTKLGIQVDKLENFNLGFEQPTGSAEIWVADFEFK